MRPFTPRRFLVGMSGPGSIANLRELFDPIHERFDGLVWVLHDARGPAEDQYLESIKGAGAIIHIPFARRHAFSRNHYLWCGPLQDGDWCVQVDDMERLNGSFVAMLGGFLDRLDRAQINTVFYFNKPLAFRWDETLEYVGSPHEGLRRHDGKMRAIEMSGDVPNEREVRYNVRAAQRGPFHWVDQYAKYTLYPMSNHGQLGLENRGDPSVLWPIRERNRVAFIDEMIKRGHPRTLDGLNALFAPPLDDTLRALVNTDKVWTDYYRFHVLGDQTVLDEHEWSSFKTI